MSSSLYITLSIVLFSALLTVIVYFGNVGREFLYIVNEQRELQKNMALEKDFYKYDNKILTGDDVLLTVQKYTKVINMDIELGGAGSGVFISLKEDGSDADWSIDRIRSALGHNIFAYYRSELVYDGSGAFVGLRFMRM